MFLASAELAAIASKLGHIPTVAEYHQAMGIVNKGNAAIYKYLNFNQIEEYVENAPDGHFKFPHPWPPQIPPGSALRL